MAIEKLNASSSLAEVIDRILELLAIEARVVVVGVDTYLKYAEAGGLTAGGLTASAAAA